MNASASFHLAQLNIGVLREPLDSERMAGFVEGLDPVNATADDAPGFVWRLQTEDGDATSIRAFDDDLMIVNMSVWESVESLRAFVYSSPLHKSFLRRRREWFEQMDVFMVLWWVTAGHLPDVEEAKERLATLRERGPTPEAFTFRASFGAPDPAAGSARR